MAWKNTIKNAILNALVHQYNVNSAASTNVSLPSAGWMCLYTAMPTLGSNGEFTGGTEVSGGGYHRLNMTAVGLGGEHYFETAAATDNQGKASITNSIAIQFAQSTAAWGSVVGIGIMENENPTGGESPYLIGELTTPVTVAENETLSFAAGQLKLTLQ